MFLFVIEELGPQALHPRLLTDHCWAERPSNGDHKPNIAALDSHPGDRRPQGTISSSIYFADAFCFGSRFAPVASSSPAFHEKPAQHDFIDKSLCARLSSRNVINERNSPTQGFWSLVCHATPVGPYTHTDVCWHKRLHLLN
ncbi:hypothetical protein EVAR_17519_1 [Eumeta japonica]|uniref:Uncharacterized protein n=1 Tax=Eumeta variegata TaxID=151549 RepID=A0A4C1WTQ5_EUMVA|nr:hypothetical protein EVAR_17519_1 [Eumeta japonica]